MLTSPRDLLEERDDVTLEMAHRARPLHQRSGSVRTEPNGQAYGRLMKWRKEVDPAANGSWAKRLAWDHLTEAELAVLLQDDATRTDIPDAGLRIITDAYDPMRLRQSLVDASIFSDRVLGEEPPAVFEEVFVPLVQYARERLVCRTGESYGRFATASMVELERGLLRRLSQVASQALYSMFSPIRNQQQATLLSLLMGRTEEADTAIVYRSFIRHVLSDPAPHFFLRYPVAARLCARITELWIAYVAELIIRLDGDRDTLAARFNGGRSLGRVASCSVDMGDVHDDGKAVLILTFESGCRIVYKPRPVGLETVYRQIVAWLNAELEEDLHLYAPDCLEGDGYGWVEFIPHEPCNDLRDVEEYYRKLGVALATVYCLHGNDFHCENIIASGKQPVLIDMEALLAPRFSLLPDRVAAHALQEAQLLQQQSVLATGLLPIYKKLGDRISIDLGAMGGARDDDDALVCAYWQNPNTDVMRLAYKQVRPKANANLPICDGQRCYATDHIEAVVDGFAQAYRVFEQRGSRLLDMVGPQLACQRVRFIFRATAVYHALLLRSCHPSYLKSGADRSILFESLTRALLSFDEKPCVWPIVRQERASLEQMDIPLFEVDCESRDLVLDDGTRLSEVFESSPVEACRDRLRSLCDTDLHRQQSLIRLSLAGRGAASLMPPETSLGSSYPLNAPTCLAGEGHDIASVRTPDIRSTTHDLALRVVEELERRQIRAGSGSAWFGLHYDPSICRYITYPGLGLFSGNSGVALFAAATWSATGDHRAATLAHRALRPLEDFETSRDIRSLLGLDSRSPRLGVGDGVGSAVYALTHVARLLQEERYLELAIRLATSVTPEIIRACNAFHVYGGLAGLILALLPLYQATGDSDVLRLAVLAGNRMAANDAVTRWTPAHPEGFFLTEGILLGPTGALPALHRLYRVSSHSAYLDLCHILLRREDQRWKATTPETPGRMSWIEGLTGTGLACLEITEVPNYETRIRNITERLLLAAWPTTDEPSAGVLGPLAFLFHAADRLADTTCRARAERALHNVLARIQSRGDVTTGWGERVFHPGLYQGHPGVAYLLLRLTGLASCPCILSWQ